jgi:hypothetical protein
MRAFLRRVALVGAFLTLAVSAPAWAHVVVSPEEEVAALDHLGVLRYPEWKKAKE